MISLETYATYMFFTFLKNCPVWPNSVGKNILSVMIALIFRQKIWFYVIFGSAHQAVGTYKTGAIFIISSVIC